MGVGVRESVALARGALLTVRGRKIIPELVLCPPTIALTEVRKVVARSVASLGAQSVAHIEKGALTGEVSMRMLDEVGVSYVIIGHSERRAFLAETDERVRQKVGIVMGANSIPVVCVGENSEQRNAGEHKEVVKQQIIAAFDQIHLKSSQQILVAYEPIWAIGSGQTAEVSDVIEMHEFIRDLLAIIFPNASDDQTAVLYGGSVNSKNIRNFSSNQEIDGFLIGGASQSSKKFIDIIKNYYK